MKKAFLIFGAALLLAFSGASCLGAGEAVKVPVSGPSATALIGEARERETEPSPAPETAGEKAALEFENREGNISFSFDTVEIEKIPETMPVLRMRPKVIDSDWARTMAEAIFGDNTLYEYSEEMSRAEIGEKIAEYEDALREEAIKESLGEDASREEIAAYTRAIEEQLDFYSSAYEYARDKVEPVECLWTFWPSTHYAQSSWDYAGGDTGYKDQLPYGATVELCAQVTMDGLPYRFNVNNREAEDFRNHSMYALLMPPMYPGTPDYTPWMVENGVYSDREPGTDEVEAVEEKAREMIEAMDIGDWELEARVESGRYAYLPQEGVGYGIMPEDLYTSYDIVVDCRRVYEGVTVTKHPMLMNMRSTQPGASNYYFEELELRYCADGRLQNLTYWSPHELLESRDSGVVELDIGDIESILTDWTTENIRLRDSLPLEAELLDVDVEIFSIELGLSRIKLDDTDFLLIPTLTLPGMYTLEYGLSGGTESDTRGSEASPVDILVIDLRDGSVIELGNP